MTAGYHWFGSWGRDTLIALPGLTFYAGRPEEGTDVLLGLGSAVRDGLIPNVFSADGQPRLQLGGRLPLVCLGRAADAQGAAGSEGFDP